ncbi:MAG TPA: carbohydrate-binding family 9-like protein [bacterium]|nr:carbohydrate-binding family 9-like protein [bacterium]
MKTYHVRKVEQPVPVEGSLAQEPWTDAEAMELLDCVTGELPRMSTYCKLLWDNDCLYAGYQVEDEKVVSTYTERDEPLYEEDVVELFLAPASGLKYYYEFNFSPKNVVLDAIVLNDDGRAGVGRGDLMTLTQWDCRSLHVNARLKDRGWVVTAAIPFAQLHFAENRPPQPGDIWRANLCRIEYGGSETEYSAWSPPEILDFHTTEKFGEIVFAE